MLDVCGTSAAAKEHRISLEHDDRGCRVEVILDV